MGFDEKPPPKQWQKTTFRARTCSMPAIFPACLINQHTSGHTFFTVFEIAYYSLARFGQVSKLDEYRKGTHAPCQVSAAWCCKKTPLLLSFPYVCPKPVLANDHVCTLLRLA
jgi:hypothetical protein